jgi:hypothetical protein
MVSISLKGHVRADGMLEIRVPTPLPETDVEVLVVLEPVQVEGAAPAKAGWPEGYFDRTFGSLRDNPITHEPPPDFETRTEWR